ncbi:MAG: hypothetical protein IT371_14260 [Deltaproteobacteria bacterium]|nr:hypothetical protein [Deltaproteobacteria bacterium]
MPQPLVRWGGVLLVGAGLALAVLGGAGRAYVPGTTDESQKPLRWMFTNCVVLRANSAGSDNVADATELDAVKRATENWQRVTSGCGYLTFSVQPPSPDAQVGLNRKGTNENVVVWVEKDWKHDKEATGITTVFFVDHPGSDQDGRILDGDIELNGEGFLFGTQAERTRHDVENTVTHELGHLMGLDHPCDDGTRKPVPKDNQGKTLPKCDPLGNLPAAMKETTMFNFADRGETKKRSPEGDDVLGICATYPKSADPKVCAPVVLDEGGCSVAGHASPKDVPAAGLALVALWLGARRTRRRHA